MVFLFHLQSLPSLFSLNICFTECDENLGDIYGILFQFPVLKYLRFEVSQNEGVHVKIPIASEGQYSSIEYLAIHFSCTPNELTDWLKKVSSKSVVYKFSCFQRMLVRNCVFVFLEHDQLSQHG